MPLFMVDITMRKFHPNIGLTVINLPGIGPTVQLSNVMTKNVFKIEKSRPI